VGLGSQTERDDRRRQLPVLSGAIQSPTIWPPAVIFLNYDPSVLLNFAPALLLATVFQLEPFSVRAPETPSPTGEKLGAPDGLDPPARPPLVCAAGVIVEVQGYIVKMWIFSPEFFLMRQFL
jgi:hypothetical protein